MGGAAGPKTAAHIAEFCDGWMPLGGMYDFEGGMKNVADACNAIGRDPSSLQISVFYGMGCPDADTIKKHADQGVKRVICALPPQPADAALPMLDQYAKNI
tara:strand:- start:332 stop:634 length:303 start_codon:yes stop_codon:yes gene_type:complete